MRRPDVDPVAGPGVTLAAYAGMVGRAWWCAGALAALLLAVGLRADLTAVVVCVIGLALCAALAHRAWPSGAWATSLGTALLVAAVGALVPRDLAGGSAWAENVALGYAAFGYVVCGVAWLGPGHRRDAAIWCGHAVLFVSSFALYASPEGASLVGLTSAALVTAVVGRRWAGPGLTRRRRVRRWVGDLSRPGKSGGEPLRGARAGRVDSRTAAVAGALDASGIEAHLRTSCPGNGACELVILTSAKIYLVWTRQWSATLELVPTDDGPGPTRCAVDGDPRALSARVRPILRELADTASRLRVGPDSLVGVVAFWDDTVVRGGPLDLTVWGAEVRRGRARRLILARGEELGGWLRAEVAGSSR